MQAAGKSLIIVGAFVVLVGLVLMFSDKIPFLGKLPGDITIKRGSFQFTFPLATSIVLSVLLSVVLWILSHFKGR